MVILAKNVAKPVGTKKSGGFLQKCFFDGPALIFKIQGWNLVHLMILWKEIKKRNSLYF